MAVDEAILRAVAAGRVLPTLRLYDWEPPCLSLGRAQKVSDVDLDALQTAGFDLVRRSTGGKAILHVDELTYSVVAPQGDHHVSGSIIESYRRLSAGLVRGLERLGVPDLVADRRTPLPPVGEAGGGRGPVAVQFSHRTLEPPSRGRPMQRYAISRKGFRPQDAPGTGAESIGAGEAGGGRGPVCFESPSDYEITVGKRKLVGSAQMRSQGVVLQHGTLPLYGDITRICSLLTARPDPAHVRARATTIAEALMSLVTWDEAADALAAGFAEALNLRLEPGVLTGEERAWARELRAEKYATEEWTRQV